MTDAPEATSTPLVVNPDPVPAMLATAARYAAALLAGWLIRRGYIGHADEALISGLVLAIVTTGYALWRSHSAKAQLVTVARAADDSVARVKGE
ncbi:hypothetical protein PQ455_01400 [Sphingomonas naphthae]|uniref:DUF202 domain-containing protein n=1 Tax=Sphingomonas naphthae TaxID=1813468 RepID=A0ABY7TMC9_9SPHN|nr:hypothetical protein [Sphingomonas naphthae]WCT73916.1 hypothetical protein PQ455_01400 [Sphingomonas naphthae]